MPHLFLPQKLALRGQKFVFPTRDKEILLGYSRGGN